MSDSGQESGTAGAEPDQSMQSGAVSALTMQTILDQQQIIERQRELVIVLKKRVEELEIQQQRQRLQPHATVPAKLQQVSSSSSSYEAGVQLQRRIQSAEKENAELKGCVAGLQDELAAVAGRLQEQRLVQLREELAWKEKLSAAEAKEISTSQMLDVMEQRSIQLTEQVDSMRREADVRLYEGVQWQSLVATIIQRLDEAQGRCVKEQISLIEDSVRRYAARQAPPGGASLASSSRRVEPEEEKAVAESRHMWSRKAQSQLPLMLCNASPQREHAGSPERARFLTSMNVKTDQGLSEGAVARTTTAAAAATSAGVEVQVTHERTRATPSSLTAYTDTCTANKEPVSSAGQPLSSCSGRSASSLKGSRCSQVDKASSSAMFNGSTPFLQVVPLGPSATLSSR
ncbi:hypothetical protein ABL78_7422 [Leptomonas seymouri]|uniref:Uncharacterized protein n=1 Tax=Leptomonas seymouri TaxID=5684 RepID=A0A0N0P3D4_LEPSE|nr:hypothetical protein ABL78_7422 [Leptomonas seymouri]|eukprot:KPI83537.1 hypothetical protein ABL78_7422 [Leptomonas seymouri]